LNAHFLGIAAAVFALLKTHARAPRYLRKLSVPQVANRASFAGYLLQSTPAQHTGAKQGSLFGARLKRAEEPVDSTALPSTARLVTYRAEQAQEHTTPLKLSRKLQQYILTSMVYPKTRCLYSAVKRKHTQPQKTGRPGKTHGSQSFNQRPA